MILIPPLLASHWPETGHWDNVQPVGQGHIHASFRVEAGQGTYFLQRFNHMVFPSPETVAHNIIRLHSLTAPSEIQSLPAWIPTSEGKPYACDEEGHLWRIFPWIEATEAPHSPPPEQLALVAKAYGRWTRHANQLELSDICPPIAEFHNLSSSWTEFTDAWNQAGGHRKYAAAETYFGLCEGAWLVERYLLLVKRLPLRIIHADAKLDNVLFHPDTRLPSHVVDLDTMMPGYLWMDLGDMIRSMAASFTEEDPRVSEVHVKEELVEAILAGYCESLSGWMLKTEEDTLLLGAELILWEQALRFLTDYLREDRYYPVSYPEENLVRAQNQWMLWDSFGSLTAHFRLD